MSWLYRNYSTYLGRWTQADKLGIIPNDNGEINPYNPIGQYKDSLNLYEALASNPVRRIDIFGLDFSFDPDVGIQDPPSHWPAIPSVETPSFNSDLDIPSYIGGEIHFFLGYGRTFVTCCDENKNRRSFVFGKWCFGGAAMLSASAGPVFGISGKKCRKTSYEGWFYEIGGGVGCIGGGADIGYDDENWNLPGFPTGTVEIGAGLGGNVTRFGGKSTWCRYKCIKQKIKKCACETGCEDFDNNAKWTECSEN